MALSSALYVLAGNKYSESLDSFGNFLVYDNRHHIEATIYKGMVS